VQVQTTASFTGAGVLSGVSNTFSSATPRIWCVATFTQLTPQDAVTFKWMNVTKHTALFYYQAQRLGVTSAPLHLWSYLLAVPGGKYSCEVWENNARVGQAPFTVR
jgi:hypothetical protein